MIPIPEFQVWNLEDWILSSRIVNLEGLSPILSSLCEQVFSRTALPSSSGRGVGPSVQGALAPRGRPATNPQHVETCVVVLRSTAKHSLIEPTTTRADHSLQISHLPPDFVPLLLPVHQSINIYLVYTVRSIHRPHPSTHDNKWRTLKREGRAKSPPRHCKLIQSGMLDTLHYLSR